MNQHLLTPKVVAEMIGVTEGTLNTWRCTKRYPLPYLKFGRSIRYRRQDVLDFIASFHEKEGRSADADRL